MKKYGVNELRQMFLDFFESKGHLCKNSYSLIPHNDNSVLLIPAGMAPLKPYFTGQEVPPRRRMATCQKCIRTGDIENVGITARHLTFFEMLGNFSFGDYFKNEAIEWSWEFLTEVVGLDPDRLYPSIYQDDDEAFEIWNKKMGIPADRIFRFGKEDNFWEHGSGPCGPCSEIYYDRGEKYGCGKPTCTVGCDCDRYMEIWNNVFTQFDGDGKGNYVELENKNIDTGMGLERLAVVVQDVDTVFSIDTFKALLDEVSHMAQDYAYETDPKKDISVRVIVDHIRSVTFMVSDGILPSNEGRGYVLRRLLRRAARHGRMLGIEDGFLTKLSLKVIELSKDGYPELETRQEFITKVIGQEEEKFARLIDSGLAKLDEMTQAALAEGKKELSGDDAFKLYDTFGFPLDLTKEILAEKEMTVDEDTFAAAMEHQKEMARSARKGTNYMGEEENIYARIDAELTTEFVGYEKESCQGTIQVLTTADEIVEALTDGQEGTILTDITPFYATKGGQNCDAGVITLADGSRFAVRDVLNLKGGKVGHVGVVERGVFRTGDSVTLTIDHERRAATCKNHSATHLLQKALQEVLGSHVAQAGSYNDEHTLRFDFSHFQAMTAQEIADVEAKVNEMIRASYPVETKVMSLEEAQKTGAMALFGEKYGDEVRVVTMGTSTELCGGTHVKNTADINCFKILSESGIAAGVRRIEALTSANLLAYYASVETMLRNAAAAAKTTPASLVQRITQLEEDVKAARAENEKLKDKLAKASMGDVMDQVKEVKGVRLLATSVDGLDMNGLRNLGDQLRDKLGDGVLVLASAADGKVSLVVSASDGAQKAGAHAGNLIKAIAKEVGGGGGGRPNMAQAGGKNPAGIPAALTLAEVILAGQLK